MNPKIKNRIKLFLSNSATKILVFLVHCRLSKFINLIFKLLNIRFHLFVSKATTFSRYVELHPLTSSIIYIGDEIRKLVYAPPRYNKSEGADLYQIEHSPRYLAIIQNTMVIGGSNLVITKDGYGLNDMFALDTLEKIKFNGRAFRGTIGYRKIISVVPPASTPAIEKGIMLSANFSLNYYHYTIEILPRFEFIDRVIPLDVPLIVDVNMTKYPQYRELLNYFNHSKRPIITIPVEEIVEVGELYYPSIAPYIEPDIKSLKHLSFSGCLFDTEALDFVRQKMLAIKSNNLFAHKIFLYRTGGVRNFNQDEVFNALEPYGFKKVQTEQMSISDQVTLFNDAEIIVGGSGAALTNLIYCKPSCKVFVLVRSRLPYITVFSTIAAYFNLELQYISADISTSMNSMNLHVDFKIESQKIISCLIN